MRAVLIATCAELPFGDDDGVALLEALSLLDVRARWQVWDDPVANWADHLVVVRSTWDYSRDRDAFLAWAAQVPRIENPAAVLGWNSDKTYLRDVAEAGLPVVATTFVAPGETACFPTTGEFVLKPSVGAGSMGVGRFDATDAANANSHLAALHDAGRVALVQPYLDEVDVAGETALVYFDGTYSHAIRKGAMLAPQTTTPLDRLAPSTLYAFEHIEAREPSAAELAVGEQAMTIVRARLGTDLLYARVDLLPTLGGPVLVELELTEPSLFLSYADGAADRLAAAIAART